MKKEFLDYLEDIIEAMESVTRFVENIDYFDFTEDDKTTSAVIRKLEIIGEAIKKVPAKVKKEYPEIPWKKMAGMRDKLIHEYFGIDLKRVWRTIKEDIPYLKPKIRDILKKYEE